MQILEY